MKEKEEAIRIVDEYLKLNMNGIDNCFIPMTRLNAKQCALIHVEGIIETNPVITIYEGDKYDPLVYTKSTRSASNYWQEVKKQIELL